jgi:diguanylate cyclase
VNSQLILRNQLTRLLWLLLLFTLGSVVWSFITLYNVAQNSFIEAFFYVSPRVLGAIVCVIVTREHKGKARIGWAWASAGLICYAVASLVYQGLALTGFTPFPSVADIGYLLYPFFLIIGLSFFVQGSFHPRERLRLTLDALIIAVVVAIYIWFALLAPALAAHIARDTVGLDMVLSTIYLIQDLVVLGVLLVCLSRWTRMNFQRMGLWLLGGWTLFTVADGYFLARCFIDGLPTKHPLETGWNWWALCFAMAGVQSLRTSEVIRPLKFEFMRLSVRQYGVYAALIVVLPLVLVLPQRAEDFQRLGVQIGIGVLLLLVIVRQMVFSLHLEQANTELQGLSASLERRVQERTEALSFQASHDLLTGLANRIVFEKMLLEALENSTANTAVMFMDLDRFKQINDTLGHALGDLVLFEVANRMQAVLPPQALLARHGGDEFMLCLPNLEPDQARGIAQETAELLLKNVRAPFLVENSELYLDMSIGASFAPLNGETVSVLEQQADAAMYHAKRNGLGYAEFSLEMRSSAVQRLEIEGRLRRDIETLSTDPHFWLVYQPIVDVSSRKIVGMEALLRHKAFSTNLIIPIAEESGLMVRLGAWVLEQACTQMAIWDVAGFSVPISVNVSTVQFERPDFVEVIQSILQRSQLRPELLQLELLESVLVTRFEDTAVKMQQLRDHGVRFALDDFGTGYSSLAYLHRLPFDTIKIDRSFVHGLQAPTRNTRPLIQAIFSIAQAFGSQVVVEGVEAQAELRELLEMGATLSQGYFFARPSTATDLEPKLRVGML